MAIDDLKQNSMMKHLVESLERGEDIGHYGRLVFAMVARHFLDEETLCQYLQCNLTEEQATALCRQVEGRDYNPPRRQRILEWQAEQEFPICPDADDPGSCNVYKDLKFPDHVYEHIQEFYEQKA